MPSYNFTVARDGRWWMIHIPAINGLTQARHSGEIELMAREYVAVSQGIAVDEVRVRRLSRPRRST